MEDLGDSLVSLQALEERFLPSAEDEELDGELPPAEAGPPLPACRCRPLEVCKGSRLFRPRLSDSAAGALDSRRWRAQQQA